MYMRSYSFLVNFDPLQKPGESCKEASPYTSLGSLVFAPKLRAPLCPSTNSDQVRGQGVPASHRWGAHAAPHGGRRDARNALAQR
jgi:hypothetical protein